MILIGIILTVNIYNGKIETNYTNNNDIKKIEKLINNTKVFKKLTDN